MSEMELSGKIPRQNVVQAAEGWLSQYKPPVPMRFKNPVQPLGSSRGRSQYKLQYKLSAPNGMSC